jgi:Ca2+/Na+ antiporter
MKQKKKSVLLLALSILLSIGGLAGFIYLFILDFNFYWLFLSPVIIALYQIPAAFVFWLYKRKRAVHDESGQTEGQHPGTSQP